MIRRILIAAAVFSIGMATGFYLTRRPAPPPLPRASLDGMDQRVLPQVEMGRMTLGEAVDYVRKQTGVQVVINWPALKANGFGPATRYDPDLSLKDVTVEQLLGRMSHTDCGDSLPLRFSRADGFLELETRRREFFDGDYTSDNRVICTYVYTVADLLLKDGPWERLCIPNDKHPFKPPLTCDERELLLSDTITTLVDHEGWHDEGGQRGTLRFIMGELIVSQTPANHQAIDEIIETLRAAK